MPEEIKDTNVRADNDALDRISDAAEKGRLSRKDGEKLIETGRKVIGSHDVRRGLGRTFRSGYDWFTQG